MRLPPLPDELPVLDGPGGALARAGPAVGRIFSASGRRITAWGSDTRGVAGIRSGDWTLVADLRSGSGPASGVVVGPSSVRREGLVSGGSVLETLLVPVDVAAAAVQWRRPPGAEAPLALELRWTVAWHGPGTPVAEVEDHVLRVGAPGGGNGPAAFFVVHPAPRGWDVRPEGGTLHVSVAAAAGDAPAVTLLVAAGGDRAEALAALRAVAGLRAQEARAEQRLDEARREGLSVRTGVPALDEGLEWAKARIRGAVEGGARGRRIRSGGGPCENARAVRAAPKDAPGAPPPGSPPVEEVWTALGALAAGDPEPAEIVLEGEIPTAYHVLLAGRYAAWTGRAGALVRRRGPLEAAAERAARHVPDPVASAALRELADAWEALGDAAGAADLRSRAPGPRERGRPLPMLGRDGGVRPDGEDALLEAALGQGAGAVYHAAALPEAGGVVEALRAWALCRAGDPEAGYLLLRGRLESGLQAGGMWSDGSPGGRASCPDHAASAALAPAVLLFGMLGAVADAAAGRLRLAPRLPGAWRAFDVGGIRVGDAVVRLRYTREAGGHVFRVHPEAGRTPLMLILEPEVATDLPVDPLVDGVPARLERFGRGGRAGVRVQLPLDRERSLTLVPERPGRPTWR